MAGPPPGLLDPAQREIGNQDTGMPNWRTPLYRDRVKSASYCVRTIPDRCKGCRFCIEYCPRKVLKESEGFNAKGYHPVYAATEDDCAGCGLCEAICPEFAIDIVPSAQGEVHDRK
jgi:2-oxoglutarate ferredoxin oxidoreductase subunit delta